MADNIKLLEELVVEAVDRLRSLTREREELRGKVAALSKRLEALKRKASSSGSGSETAKAWEARRAQASGASEADLDRYRKELRGMEDEIRRDAEAADVTLAERREAVLRPLLEKLEQTIQDVAKEEGFTFVINAVDGDGNSIVLFGDEGRDITEKVATRLGIESPEGD